MKKLLNSKYWWISWLVLLLAVNYLASVFHYRLDFTQEKRYTLSKATKNLLKGLNDFVTIDVYLKGDLKSGVKKLAQSTDELLQDFKDYSNGRLRVRFIDPIGDYTDSIAAMMIDSLGRMGLRPMTQVAQTIHRSVEYIHEHQQPAAIHDILIQFQLLIICEFRSGLYQHQRIEFFGNKRSRSQVQRIEPVIAGNKCKRADRVIPQRLTIAGQISDQRRFFLHQFIDGKCKFVFEQCFRIGVYFIFIGILNAG